LEESTDDTEQAVIESFWSATDSVQLVSIGKSLLNRATTRFVYDFSSYMNFGRPAVAASISSE
jgi:hypothetical protein